MLVVREMIGVFFPLPVQH